MQQYLDIEWQASKGKSTPICSYNTDISLVSLPSSTDIQQTQIRNQN